MTQVTLYTKPGCHLCEDVRRVIVQVQKIRAFELESRNIEDEPAEFEKYKDDIPVVAVNGQEIARHRLSEVRLVWGLDTYGQSE